MALTLKIYNAISRQKLCQWLVGMETSSIGKAEGPLLHVYIIDQARGQDSWKLAEFSFLPFYGLSRSQSP